MLMTFQVVVSQPDDVKNIKKQLCHRFCIMDFGHLQFLGLTSPTTSQLQTYTSLSRPLLRMLLSSFVTSLELSSTLLLQCGQTYFMPYCLSVTFCLRLQQHSLRSCMTCSALPLNSTIKQTIHSTRKDNGINTPTIHCNASYGTYQPFMVKLYSGNIVLWAGHGPHGGHQYRRLCCSVERVSCGHQCSLSSTLPLAHPAYTWCPNQTPI